MKNLNVVDWVAVVLTIVGGLNWGLVGLSPDRSWDLVALVGGGPEGLISRIVYILVGLSAIWLIFTVSKKGGSSSSKAPEMNQEGSEQQMGV